MGKERWIALLLVSLFALQSVGFAVDTNESEEEITVQTVDPANDVRDADSASISVFDPEPEMPELDTAESYSGGEISSISISRSISYPNKKNADVSQICVTFESDFEGYIYYTESESCAENILREGQKKAVTKGNNALQISNSSDQYLWLGWENGEGKTNTTKVKLNPPTVYSAKMTLNPATAKLTIKYDGTTLTPMKSGDGTYYYELIIGETYQFIAKVPNSQKYKEVNQTVTIQKKSNITIDVTRGAGRLSDLILNTDSTNYQNSPLKLSAQFSGSIDEYFAELVGSLSTAYLWLKPYKDTTKLTVTSGGKTLSATSKSGYLRYTVKFSDGETKKSIKVTASGDDGTVNTYTITVEHYEKFELSLVRDLTGRTGSNTVTLTISSPREGNGYLKIVNPDVNVTDKEIISEGYKFDVNKGNTMLKISGFGSMARDLYIIARDADGNCTPRLKISISDYGSNSKNFMSLSHLAYTYNGKVKKPTVTVRDNTGKKISSKYYTVSYAKGRKNVGSYKVTVKFTGTKYSGTLSKTFSIKPKATVLKTLTASSRSFTAKWAKQATQTTGYQLQYSTSSKFTNAKTVLIKNNKTTSQKVSKLSAKKKYYVRVRTYKTVSGKKYYSSWSTKTITTKK